jgi:TorA maturation chaperone TorD
MGKPLSNLRDDIRAMGLESQDTQKDPTDHIAGVFEVMRLSISGLSLSLEQQKIFFEKNIASWVDEFFNDLSKI